MSAKQIFIFCSNNSQDWTLNSSFPWKPAVLQHTPDTHEHAHACTRPIYIYIYIYIYFHLFPLFLSYFPQQYHLSKLRFTISFWLFWSLSSIVLPFSLHFPLWHSSTMFSPPYRLSRLSISIALVRILLPSREKAWISLSLSLSLSHIHTHIAFATFSFLPTCQISPCRSSSIGWVARRARLSQSLAQSDTVVMWRYARQSLQLVQVSRRRIVTMLVYIFLFPFQMLARSSISLLARIAPRFREFRGMRAQHSEY